MNRQLELDINRPAWHEVDFGVETFSDKKELEDSSLNTRRTRFSQDDRRSQVARSMLDLTKIKFKQFDSE